ncbi:indolepyruvate ferredoxin oxidoreductase subunit alpha [Anaerotignum propionicum]|uniref:indolepyruvate ferredoxin oxidoreductase subunit alpha n=1 Tax=Anaerotignum propionicum TaxID=28446 RepID=UPI002F407DAD
MTNKYLHKSKISIDPDRCVGCGACIINCPVNAISMMTGWISSINQEKCIVCGKCLQICHRDAPIYALPKR